MQHYYLLLSFNEIIGSKSNQTNRVNLIKNGFEIPPDFKILIIDDDIDFLRALEFRLSRKNIKVTTADSGQAAIDVIKKTFFDLILLDLKMPGMNGAETLKKILEIKSRSFVIIMTAYSEDELVEIVKKMGPFGFINKPFDWGELIPFIKKRIEEGKYDK